jgi:hypothetical protein
MGKSGRIRGVFTLDELRRRPRTRLLPADHQMTKVHLSATVMALWEVHNENASYCLGSCVFPYPVFSLCTDHGSR